MQPWPKDILRWQSGRTGYLSVPFTWLLPKAKRIIMQRDAFVDHWIAGGPAIVLMPDYLLGLPCTLGTDMPGILQRTNPEATRTTLGCIRHCPFCGVPRIEGRFRELDEWPNLPVICDNNLLAASHRHFDRVVDRLVHWGWCDFNQGLDARLLTPHHARRIAEIDKPLVRLALDHDRDRTAWANAVDTLLDAGLAQSRVRSYVLCGFDGTPETDWERCEFVESFGLKALPMWFHPLDSVVHNSVTLAQECLGWSEEKRRQLMGWYYRHRGTRLTARVEN